MSLTNLSSFCFFCHFSHWCCEEFLNNNSKNQQQIPRSTFIFQLCPPPFLHNENFCFKKFPPLQTYLGCRLRFFFLNSQDISLAPSPVHNVWGGIFWLLKNSNDEFFFTLTNSFAIIIISTNNCNASKIPDTRVVAEDEEKLRQTHFETEVPSSEFYPAQLFTTQ